MSFAMWISAFENGESRMFRRTILEKAFGGFSDMSDPTSWKVSNSFAVIGVDDAAEIDGFAVNRPPGNDHPFWPALLGVLRETSSVLYWPCGGPAITDPSMAAGIPAHMIKALGPARVVTSIEDIFRLISES